MPTRADDPPDVQVVVARLEAIHEKLDEVHVEVRKTNGRVTALEQQRAVAQALEANNVSSRDSVLRWLLFLIAVGTLVEPVALRLAQH